MVYICGWLGREKQKQREKSSRNEANDIKKTEEKKDRVFACGSKLKIEEVEGYERQGKFLGNLELRIYRLSSIHTATLSLAACRLPRYTQEPPSDSAAQAARSSCARGRFQGIRRGGGALVDF